MKLQEERVFSYHKVCQPSCIAYQNVYISLCIDPNTWSVEHVSQWISWAVKEFSLEQFDLSEFALTGEQLLSLSKEDFIRRAPPHTGDVLLSHLNLLCTRNSNTKLFILY